MKERAGRSTGTERRRSTRRVPRPTQEHPMATLTDLDKLCALPTTVRAGGRDWKVPGSPPVAWMLAAEQLSELPDDADDLTIVRAIREQVADLFLIHQPDDIEDIEEA